MEKSAFVSGHSFLRIDCTISYRTYDYFVINGCYISVKYYIIWRKFKMDAQKVDMFLMTNQKYLPAEKIVFIKEKMLAADESKYMLITATEMKDPTTILLVSIFLGSLGVDRFMLGETGMGILKLLTGGVCGILTLIDWFSVQKKAKDANFNKLMLAL